MSKIRVLYYPVEEREVLDVLRMGGWMAGALGKDWTLSVVIHEEPPMLAENAAYQSYLEGKLSTPTQGRVDAIFTQGTMLSARDLHDPLEERKRQAAETKKKLLDENQKKVKQEEELQGILKKQSDEYYAQKQEAEKGTKGEETEEDAQRRLQEKALKESNRARELAGLDVWARDVSVNPGAAASSTKRQSVPPVRLNPESPSKARPVVKPTVKRAGRTPKKDPEPTQEE